MKTYRACSHFMATLGEDIYEAIMRMLNERGTDIKTIVSIATDGAPAVTGREKGAVQRLKEHHPDLLPYHCIKHQSVLSTSPGKQYSDVMENIMKLVSYLRASTSALKHRLLQTCLTKMREVLILVAIYVLFYCGDELNVYCCP